MPFDITGISNDNEFYTDHYLHDVLESDLKDVFSRWKQREDEEGIRPPDADLRSLAKEYFLARGHMEKVRNTGELLNTQRGSGQAGVGRAGRRDRDECADVRMAGCRAGDLVPALCGA